MVWRRLLEGDAERQAKMSSETVQIGDLAWWDTPWIQRPLIGVETLIMIQSGADVSLLSNNRAAGIGRWNEHRPQVRARSALFQIHEMVSIREGDLPNRNPYTPDPSLFAKKGASMWHAVVFAHEET